MAELKLDLGCGNSKKQGFVGVDNNPNAKNIDKVWNLDKFPYPFESNSVSEILASHLAEHLDDLTSFFGEIYRISKNNGKFVLKVPHYSYGFVHPLHKHGFSLGTFNFFNNSNKESYGESSFEIESVKLFWRRPGTPHGLFVNGLNNAINWFANFKPNFCERYWCYWVGGFEEIEFIAKIIK